MNPEQCGWSPDPRYQKWAYIKISGNTEYRCRTKQGVDWIFMRNDLTRFPVACWQFLNSDYGWMSWTISRPSDFTVIKSFEIGNAAVDNDIRSFLG